MFNGLVGKPLTPFNHDEIDKLKRIIRHPGGEIMQLINFPSYEKALLAGDQ